MKGLIRGTGKAALRGPSRSILPTQTDNGSPGSHQGTAFHIACHPRTFNQRCQGHSAFQAAAMLLELHLPPSSALPGRAMKLPGARCPGNCSHQGTAIPSIHVGFKVMVAACKELLDTHLVFPSRFQNLQKSSHSKDHISGKSQNISDNYFASSSRLPKVKGNPLHSWRSNWARLFFRLRSPCG